MTITFAKPHDMGDGEAETDVLVDGRIEATIYKHSVPNPDYGRMAEWYGKYVAGSYDVTFFVRRLDDRSFDVDDYPTGARGALAAAKKYARTTLEAP